MATKFYGSLVGQPLQNLAATGFGAVSNRFVDGSDHVVVRDYVTFQGGAIGDTISFGLLKSAAYIDHGNSYLWWTALGAGVTLSIGDAAHPNALANALNVAAVGTQDFEVLWTPPWIGQPLWQHLGYASDPGGRIELIGTIAGAGAANGQSLAWQIMGRNN
jgi:hypothetical protein